MTQCELEQLVKEISLRFFGQRFLHQVKINYRMTTTGGRYHLNDHHLEINAHFLLPEYHDELIGIIKHELTHYHLHLAGKGYRHRDRDFKVLLNQVGGYQFTPDIGLRRTKKGALCLFMSRVWTKLYASAPDQFKALCLWKLWW